jgi:hypothetical protein
MGWPKRAANNILGVAVIVISNQTAAPSMAQLQQQIVGSATVGPARVTVLFIKQDFGFRARAAPLRDGLEGAGLPAIADGCRMEILDSDTPLS